MLKILQARLQQYVNQPKGFLWKTEREKVEAVTDFIFLGSEITTVIAVMKLKDSCSLERKL